MPPTPTLSLALHLMPPPPSQIPHSTPTTGSCSGFKRALQQDGELGGGLRLWAARVGAPCPKGGHLCQVISADGTRPESSAFSPHARCHFQGLLREARGILSRGLPPQHCPAGSHLTQTEDALFQAIQTAPPPAVPCGALLCPLPPAVSTARCPSRAPQAPTHLSSGRRTLV